MGRCEYCHATNKRGSGRTFHRFPRSDLYLLEKWIEKFGRPNWRPRGDSLLCSAHFVESCFDRTGFLVRLHKDSVPTIFGEIGHLCISCKCAKFSSKDRTFHKQVQTRTCYTYMGHFMQNGLTYDPHQRQLGFPLKDPEILEQWIENINIESIDVEQSIICSSHFEKSCFRKVKGYWILKKGSIPTLFGSNSRISCRKIKEIHGADNNRTNGNSIVNNNKYKELNDSNNPSLMKSYEENESNNNPDEINSKETFTSIMRNCSLLPILIEPNDNRMKINDTQNRGEKTLVFTEPGRANNSLNLEKMNDNDNRTMRTPGRNQSSMILSTKEKKRILTHDHQYFDSPETLRKKLHTVRKALCEKQKTVRVQNQHIKRMQKQILSLKEVISEYRKKR